MGNARGKHHHHNHHGHFTEEEVLIYRDLTFLTEAEVRNAFQRFCALSADFVTKRLIQHHKDIIRLPADWIGQMEEFRNNPFRDRIIKCFSVAEDSSMAFPEFLEMVSVFSNDAPFELKCDYAFRIYDTTDSDVLNRFVPLYICREMIKWVSILIIKS